MQQADLWERLVNDWLSSKTARSNSPHTARSYGAAMERWRAYLADQEPAPALWEVDASHVRGWQQQLHATGLSQATINHKLSCVSSFYAWVVAETRLVEGMEVHLFADRSGRARVNPFRAGNLQRGRTRTYERARVLSRVEVSTLLLHLEHAARDVAGARNLALILTYLYTGWRSAELLRMTWGDLRPSRTQPGVMIYAWRGKGNKAADDALPGDCWLALRAYLHADGRLGVGVEPAADEPVWLPLAAPRMDQLRHGPGVDRRRPISEQTARRILRAALRGAGITHADEYRIHDLRHTHAHLLLQSGVPLPAIQQRLHHSSLATTGLYVRTVHGQDPTDVVSEAFAQLRLRTESAPE